ncbi:hypothetical protein [Kitasatospora griseola]|uniref:hypothetical protein n=1 Tax=Kitasatospora griseola TaxID=2064 RepID=UPI00342163CC
MLFEVRADQEIGPDGIEPTAVVAVHAAGSDPDVPEDPLPTTLCGRPCPRCAAAPSSPGALTGLSPRLDLDAIAPDSVPSPQLVSAERAGRLP